MAIFPSTPTLSSAIPPASLSLDAQFAPPEDPPTLRRAGNSILILCWLTTANAADCVYPRHSIPVPSPQTTQALGSSSPPTFHIFKFLQDIPIPKKVKVLDIDRRYVVPHGVDTVQALFPGRIPAFPRVHQEPKLQRAARLVPWRSLPLRNSRSQREKEALDAVAPQCRAPIPSCHLNVWAVVTGTLQGCFRASGGGQALSLWLPAEVTHRGYFVPFTPQPASFDSSLFPFPFFSNLTRQYSPLETIAPKTLITALFACL